MSSELRVCEGGRKALEGKVIERIEVTADKHAIRFHLREEEPVVVRTDADCCSHTWVESFDTPELLIGGTVTRVYDLDMREPEVDDYDTVQFYGCRIDTDKGSCVIDYRNESNGYYGGNLVWPGEYFYGGVYGQQQPEGEWVLVAPKEDA